MGEFRNKMLRENHPNYSIIKISQNTEKSPRDLMRLAVTQTLVCLFICNGTSTFLGYLLPNPSF